MTTKKKKKPTARLLTEFWIMRKLHRDWEFWEQCKSERALRREYAGAYSEGPDIFVPAVLTVTRLAP